LVDNPVKAIFEGALAKIDEKSDPKVHHTKISEKLLAVYRHQLFHRLEFDQHTTFDQQIEPECLLEDHRDFCRTIS
jgi:hypothetical protein